MKEKKKVRRKLRIKRVFVNIWKSICAFFKNIYNSFNNLPKKTKQILGVWAIVIVIIILIIIASSSNNKFLSEYESYEKKVNDAALSYVTDNEIYPSENNKLKLDINALVDSGYLNESDVVGTCGGFAVIYAKDSTNEDGDTTISYVVNTYLNCSNYTTKGYNNYK